MPSTSPDRALHIGQQLSAELVRRNIPVHVYPAGGQVAVWLWAGLVARTDGVLIWWPTLRTDVLGRPVYSYATTVAGAAVRLAEHYEHYRSAHPPETLISLYRLVPQ